MSGFQAMAVLSMCLTCFAGCKPVTGGGPDDDPTADLRPVPGGDGVGPGDTMMSGCTGAPDPQNRLRNASFEEFGEMRGSARNTFMPPSTIPGWEGCCGAMVTTTWQVGPELYRCGAYSVKITGTGASDNVLYQPQTLSDGAGRGYTVSAWVFLQGLGPGVRLSIDLFDLRSNTILKESDRLTTATSQWTQLSASGDFPTGTPPLVQVRLKGSGTFTAFADDVSLILR